MYQNLLLVVLINSILYVLGIPIRIDVFGFLPFHRIKIKNLFNC